MKSQDFNIPDLNGLIFFTRLIFRDLQDTNNTDSPEYGKRALRLALLLIIRFIKERQLDDFTEAKELEAIIRQCRTSDQDQDEQDLFRQLVDLAIHRAPEIQKMTESGLSQIGVGTESESSLRYSPVRIFLFFTDR